jgi:hypothetical protein
MQELKDRILSAITNAEKQILPLFRRDGQYAYVLSSGSEPGVWETAEAIGIIGWRKEETDILAAASSWLPTKQHTDGGFAPFPDISCHKSCVEPTSRVVLSVGPVQRFLGLGKDITEALVDACQWLILNQDDSGGWGSHRGLPPRMFPTSFAMQALLEIKEIVGSRLSESSEAAIEDAITWLHHIVNPDGGYGVSVNKPSNICSSAHAAMAFVKTGYIPPEGLSDYIIKTVTNESPSDVEDDIGHPASNIGGRYSFLLLHKPLSLLGLLSSRYHLFDPCIISLIERILKDRKHRVWKIPDGRFIWPTYFHVAALRLWCHVHSAYGTATTIDLTKLGHPSAYEIQKRRIFISHRSTDRELAYNIYRMLCLAGFDPWIDTERILAGDIPIDEIRKGINNCCAVVFLVTPNFQTEGYLKLEINLASERSVKDKTFRIIPLRFDPSIEMPEDFKLMAWKDITSDLEAAEIIVRTLNANR